MFQLSLGAKKSFTEHNFLEKFYDLVIIEENISVIHLNNKMFCINARVARGARASSFWSLRRQLKRAARARI